MIDYNITPANPLSGLGAVTGNYIQQQGEKKVMDEAVEAFKTGDPDAVAEFVIRNPQSSAAIDKAMGFKNEATKANLIQTSMDILNGLNPDQVIQDRINEVESQDGDASHTRELQSSVSGNPEAAKQKALMALAVHSPQAYKAYMDQKAKPQNPTTRMQELEAAGYKQGTPEYRAKLLSLMNKPTGTTITIGDQKTMEKATEGQLAAAGFTSRVTEANSTLEALEDSGFDPSNLEEKVASSIPGAGNFMVSDEFQEYEGAKQDFITAVLRKESGAVISDDEFKREDKKYFPQPGDSAKAIDAKRARRKRQAEVLKKLSKGVYDIQYGGQDSTPPEDTPELSIDELVKKYGN